LNAATICAQPGFYVGAICDDDISAIASANHDLVQLDVIGYDASNMGAISLTHHNPHSAPVDVCIAGHNSRIPVGGIRKVGVWAVAIVKDVKRGPMGICVLSRGVEGQTRRGQQTGKKQGLDGWAGTSLFHNSGLRFLVVSC
jgi:hypothetical protein